MCESDDYFPGEVARLNHNRIDELRAKLEAAEKHLDAVAFALHSQKQPGDRFTYLPDQLPEMIRAKDARITGLADELQTAVEANNAFKAEITRLRERVAELEARDRAWLRYHECDSFPAIDLLAQSQRELSIVTTQLAQARQEGAAEVASEIEQLLLDWQGSVEHWDGSEQEFYVQVEQLAAKLREPHKEAPNHDK